MNIRLTPGQEKIIQAESESGHFQSVEDVIAEALEALRANERPSNTVAPNGGQREAVREMLAFVEKNHARHDGISVKELIY